MLPVPYCHLVFTLPHSLNALAQFHARWVYGTLMQCAAATPSEFAANPRWLGATAAFTLVLHTWTQDLRRHIHVHALMACGGLNGDGLWCAPKRSPTFLFPVHALSRVFRGKFVDALRCASQGGELPLDPTYTPAARQARLAELKRHDSVVYAKTPLAGPETVLDYLSRYTHRVAVSNERIVGIDANGVRLRVRADDHGGKRTAFIDGRADVDLFASTHWHAQLQGRPCRFVHAHFHSALAASGVARNPGRRSYVALVPVRFRRIIAGPAFAPAQVLAAV